MLMKRYVALALTLIMAISCFGTTGVFAATGYFEPETYVEVEAGSLKNNIYTISSPYASGGVYCVSKAAVIKDANTKIDEMSYIFDIKDGGDYKIFLRAYAKSAKSLYYRWNDEPWKSYTVPAVTDFAWIELATKTLNPGKHKLQLCHGQIDVWYDALYLTKDASFVPAVPDGVEPVPEVVITVNWVQHQKDEVVVGAEGAIIEAENASLTDTFNIVSDPDASGGKAIIPVNQSATGEKPDPGSSGDMEIEFTTDIDATYYVWVRTKCKGSSYAFWATADDNAWTNKNYTMNEGEFSWDNASSAIAINGKKGEKHTVKFSRRLNGSMIDQIIIIPKATYYPKGIVTEISTEIAELVPITELPPYNPPAGVHPRLFFTEKDIPELIEKFNHPENAIVKARVEANAQKDSVSGETYNETFLYEMQSKAYMYALFKDKEIGRKAIDSALSLLNLQKWGNYPTREAGWVIVNASIVYDWCYDLLTEEEKVTLMEICIGMASGMEIGWPPRNHGSRTWTGHGAEAQLLRDQLSFAVATYDERPDFWNFIAGRFYHEYIEEREFDAAGGIHQAGLGYGMYRHQYTMWAHTIITGMGLPEPYDGYKTGTLAFGNNIYARRPDGAFFPRGDTSGHKSMSYNSSSEQFLLLSLNLSKDPYIKDELVRVSRDAGKNGYVQADVSEVGPAFWLLFNEPEVEEKSISNLPLSLYLPSPGGVMYARTGWERGVNSSAVAAEMAIGYEWNPPDGGHNHRDAGSFQIYYKGPLATDSGYYNIFGTEHHSNYTVQTIAHNTMLVYDPDEPSSNFEGAVNDGGQQYKGMTPEGDATFAGMMKYPDFYKRSTVLGHEIDPKNPIEPEYTYLKGDLTNAYSEKMSEFKRSFMFLNLENEKIPAALIVFDKVKISKPNLKKTWLLHGQSEPQISGSRSVWLSNPYVNDYGEDYTGKMVVDHMLPKKLNIDVIGGEEEGWFNINGVDHPNLNNEYAGNEQKTYRMEISEKGTDLTYFLNCIQVTDEGNTSYLKADLIDTDKFYGVKISDRAVLFSKSGEKISEKFEVSSNGKNYKYTICDLEKGNWKVILDGTEQIINVSEEGGVLSFESSAKNITAELVSRETEEAKEEPQLSDEKEIYIKIGSDLMGLPVKAKMVNGKVMAPVSALLKRMEIKSQKGFLKEIYFDESQNIEILVQEGSKYLVKNGITIPTTNAPYYENGHLMVELRPFAESFNFKVHWDNEFGNVALFADKVIFIAAQEGYANVKTVTNDGGPVSDGFDVNTVIDSNITTAWANQGEGRYIDFELSEKTILENIEIIFNPSSRRSPKFAVQVSDDGVNYTTIYSGVGSPDADGVAWEVFKFDPQILVETKYVRYVANGSDKSTWNGVKEIRFKEGQPLIRWEESDAYAKIVFAGDDGGEIDKEFLAPNIADNNARTLWAAQGGGRYVDLTLSDVETLNGVEIIFNRETKRIPKFEIHVSEDGEKFTKVYEGKGNADAGMLDWETFDFGKTAKAKYVRYVGLGSNVSLWNGVVDIRFIKAQ